jgi:hypothetical protein
MTTAPSALRPRRPLDADRPLGASQWCAILGGIAILVWSVPGIIINPDFSVGDAATAERVLGVDMNGWHALSGFLVAIPGFVAARRADWSGLFNLAAAGSLIATAIWALASSHVAGGLFYLPNGGADALLHLGTSAIFVAGAIHYFGFERGRTAGRERTA